MSQHYCVPTDPGFVTVSQAALHIGVNPRTIYRQIAAGRLEAYKVGRSIRIPVTALETPGVKAGGKR